MRPSEEAPFRVSGVLELQSRPGRRMSNSFETSSKWVWS